MSKNFAYTNNEGELLVKLARKSLTTYLTDGKKIPIPENIPEILKSKSGIFVTLKRKTEFTGLYRKTVSQSTAC